MQIPPWEDPRRVLARHGLSPKRGYSQNFLVSKHVVDNIVAILEGRQPPNCWNREIYACDLPAVKTAAVLPADK